MTPGKEPREFASHLDPFGGVAFSPDGRLLASGGEWSGTSNTLGLWEAGTAQPVRISAGHASLVTGIRFTPDGRFLVSGSVDRTIRLWEVATGKERRRLTEPDEVFAIALSPDGKTLAAAGKDRGIRLWELATGKERRRLAGHRDVVLALAFSPDGKTLASAGADGDALLWDVTRSEKATAQQPDDLWTDLAGTDAATADRAVRTLITTPGAALALLRSRLRPVDAVPAAIPGLVADLDSNRFAVRDRATRELGKVLEFAEPVLLQVLQDRPTLEVRRRVEQILEGRHDRPLSGEELRGLRAVEVLEQIGNNEAREALKRLADGVPHARRTEDARAALQRLSGRSADTP